MNVCPKNGLLVMLVLRNSKPIYAFCQKPIGVEEQRGVQDLAYKCVCFFCPYLA